MTLSSMDIRFFEIFYAVFFTLLVTKLFDPNLGFTIWKSEETLSYNLIGTFVLIMVFFGLIIDIGFFLIFFDSIRNFAQYVGLTVYCLLQPFLYYVYRFLAYKRFLVYKDKIVYKDKNDEEINKIRLGDFYFFIFGVIAVMVVTLLFIFT